MFIRILAVLFLILSISGPAAADVVRVDLRLDKAMLGGTAQDWTRTAYLSLTLRDGKAEAGKIGVARGGAIGGWIIIGWSGRVDAVDVRRTGDKFAGTVKAYITSNTVDAGAYTFTLDGEIKDGKVTGTFEAKSGNTTGKGSLVGEAQTVTTPVVVDPDDSTYALVLDKALPRGEVLKVFLDRKDGRFRKSFAFSPTFSRRPYDVDASELTLKDGELSGSVKILRPIGKTKDNPLLGTYKIKATVRGDVVRGTHAGAFGEEKGEGDVWGENLVRPTVPEPTKVSVKLEDGLFGGADWQNRAFFNFTLVQGKADMGKLFNNKGIYKAQLDKAELKFDSNTVTGTMHGTVLSGGVKAGMYTFELNGTMVGNVLVGHFTTRLGDQVKQGYFVGGISP